MTLRWTFTDYTEEEQILVDKIKTHYGENLQMDWNVWVKKTTSEKGNITYSVGRSMGRGKDRDVYHLGTFRSVKTLTKWVETL